MSSRLAVSILALSILGVSPASSGMELVWSNGSTNLNFSEARQCTLFVKTGSSHNSVITARFSPTDYRAGCSAGRS
jgi:hypothetical protein